jgi:hypothetical protein
VPDWEYRKIDLNQQRPRHDELDLLNSAGADGWELVSITANNLAYFKRPVDDSDSFAEAYAAPGACATDTANRTGPGDEVKAKYRDPVTNETWSGRGRMANWLRRKQLAGEDIDRYLV